MFMRRLLTIAMVIAATLPAVAQRGIARGGGGGGAPMRAAPAFSGARTSGVRAGGGFVPRGSGVVFTNQPGASFCRGCRSFNRGFYRRGYPYYYGWAGAYWPIYDWDAGDYGYTTNSAYAGDNGYAAQLQNELANQQAVTDGLQAELDAERSRNSEDSPRASAQPAARTSPDPDTPGTVLVFRDGSRTEIQNYAIVGPTLYEFGPHWTKKVALTDLDVPATVKTNNDRGVEFLLPAQKGS